MGSYLVMLLLACTVERFGDFESYLRKRLAFGQAGKHLHSDCHYLISLKSNNETLHSDFLGINIVTPLNGTIVQMITQL